MFVEKKSAPEPNGTIFQKSAPKGTILRKKVGNSTFFKKRVLLNSMLKQNFFSLFWHNTLFVFIQNEFPNFFT